MYKMLHVTVFFVSNDKRKNFYFEEYSERKHTWQSEGPPTNEMKHGVVSLFLVIEEKTRN